jgi:peptidoglycan hydrolase-like protein with peptidoglycan-binding domain
MSVHLSALAVKGRFIATVAAVLVAATIIITGRAEAAGVSGTPVLAAGAGMAAKPSAQVREVQRALRRRCYDLGDSGVDGRFGPQTAAAVRRLQAQRGLAVDGVVGKRTRTALRLPGRAASPPRPRSHTERSATAPSARTSQAGPTHRSKPTGAGGSRPTQGIVAADPARPNTPATPSAGEDRSPDVLATIVLLGAFAGAYFFGKSRAQSETLKASSDPELLARLARVEQIVETTAIEIERISEGQRFTTRLLGEKRAIES